MVILSAPVGVVNRKLPTPEGGVPGPTTNWPELRGVRVYTTQLSSGGVFSGCRVTSSSVITTVLLPSASARSGPSASGASGATELSVQAASASVPAIARAAWSLFILFPVGWAWTCGFKEGRPEDNRGAGWDQPRRREAWES